jgi:DNA-binding response OmpR family regulator
MGSDGRIGELVHVESKVFDLLANLIAHRDRVVPRDELISGVSDGRTDACRVRRVRSVDRRRASDHDTERRAGWNRVSENSLLPDS